MAIPTSRTKENATITIDRELCSGCGKCVTVCKDFNFLIENHKAVISHSPLFGCIGCGHCMAICPEGAIMVSGRAINADDLLQPSDSALQPSYEEVLALLQSRRSIREFKDKAVEDDVVEKIMKAARTAPMGIPPSDVNVLVFQGRDKLNQFAKEFCESLEQMKWLVSGWFLSLMKPFWGKAKDEMFRDFIKPLLYKYTDAMNKGENLVTYDAPLALYFYGSQYSDPADPLIPATYAMLAGESLGLGTCMIGAIHPFIQNGRGAKRLRDNWEIRNTSKVGIFVIFGYSSVKYKKQILRTFASETYVKD